MTIYHKRKLLRLFDHIDVQENDVTNALVQPPIVFVYRGTKYITLDHCVKQVFIDEINQPTKHGVTNRSKNKTVQASNKARAINKPSIQTPIKRSINRTKKREIE